MNCFRVCVSLAPAALLLGLAACTPKQQAGPLSEPPDDPLYEHGSLRPVSPEEIMTPTLYGPRPPGSARAAHHGHHCRSGFVYIARHEDATGAHVRAHCVKTPHRKPKAPHTEEAPPHSQP